MSKFEDVVIVETTVDCDTCVDAYTSHKCYPCAQCYLDSHWVMTPQVVEEKGFNWKLAGSIVATCLIATLAILIVVL